MDPPEDQGCMTTGCGYCQVLYPDVTPCPRCHGKPKLQAAQMLDQQSVERAVAEAVTAYDGSRQRLEALLHLLFVYRPASITALADDGRITIERLKQDNEQTPR
tara:strand:- start:32219 stop:32530 length:312 start_codon:yes stop_codon:yes gene_type:complete